MAAEIYDLLHPPAEKTWPLRGFIAHACIAHCGKCSEDLGMAPNPDAAITTLLKLGWAIYPGYGWVCPRCRQPAIDALTSV